MMLTDTRITMLVDNQAGKGQAGEGLASEHGLSFWIESEGKQILLDTGQGRALEHNAPALGIDLGKADILVLSHGHYDHTGGVAYVLRRAKAADVYCHPGVRLPRYAVRDGKSKPIGIPRRSLRALDGWPPEHVHWVQRPLQLSDKIGVAAPIPRVTGYEDAGGPFYLDPEGKRPDTIEDDLALWIETVRGVIVCLGCAHAGLVNTLDHIRALTRGARVRAVIGGFHLGNAGPERLDETIAALRASGSDLVVPCHCTGEAAVTALSGALGERVVPGAAGTTFKF
jgi:7,8-dihydropterin-6-yl-methyl-4-(beta-D-ribofuranosyl)aminobenzene 5'-phosphate synthase